MTVTITTPAALAATAARRIAAAAAAAIEARGRFTLALAGGSTPRAAYELLAGAGEGAVLDWANTDVFFGDERCVPPDHADSNARMARESLLDHVAIPAGRVHVMRGDGEDLDVAAREYAETVRRVTGDSGRLDFVLLGVGDDGHTASIFPDVVDDCRGPAFAASIDSSAKGPRLTLTLPAINAARQVVFLVGGAGKAEVVETIIADGGGDPPLPAALVAPAMGTLEWLLDSDAARRLDDA